MFFDGASLDLVARLNLEMRRRVLMLPRRPETFKPLEATAAQLDFYGLPQKPGKDDKIALALWQGLVSATPVPLADWTSILPFAGLNYRIAFNEGTGGTHQQTSENWSGAIIEAEAGRPFAQVYGQWKVPSVSLPAGALEGVEYRCSTWIGLDGANPTSGSMPQIGTTQTVKLKDGSPEVKCEAWFQWWMKSQANPPVPLAIDVAIGDIVICALDVQGPKLVVLSLTNVTQNKSMSASVAAPAESIGGPWIPIFYIADVEGHTAEWVAERPMKLGSTDLYPLPDFQEVVFEGAMVESAPPRIVRDLSPARLIRMTERHPTQTLVLSRAKKDDIHPANILHVGPGVARDLSG